MVAIQVLGWVAGGLIMTAIPIEHLRGENHQATPRLPPIDTLRLLSLEKLGKCSPRLGTQRWRELDIIASRVGCCACNCSGPRSV